MKRKGKRRNKDDGIFKTIQTISIQSDIISQLQNKNSIQTKIDKKMKTSIYYFILNDETISIKMLRKTQEELKAYKEALHAEKVYININGTKLIFDL